MSQPEPSSSARGDKRGGLAPAPYAFARVRYSYGARSEKTGRFAGEEVRWLIPEGHDIYDPGEGCGVVLVPNDGGFVWIASEGREDIVPAEFVQALDAS